MLPLSCSFRERQLQTKAPSHLAEGVFDYIKKSVRFTTYQNHPIYQIEFTLGKNSIKGEETLKVNIEEFNFASETDRLLIRPLQNDDYENWLREFENRHPSQNRHDRGRINMQECTLAWFHNLVDKHQELARTDIAYVFGVFRKEDGTHLGMIDFSTLAREDFQWARIGYTIHNQYWRNGYGKEAVQEGLKIAFTQLKYHRIEAHINLDNAPSAKLAESAGMEFEGIRKGFIFENDEWTDHLIYCKTSN